MLKRDAENARLREQRDQHFSELVERRQRDERKWAALVEFKELTQNQTVSTSNRPLLRLC
jgi:hypothetical protein